MELMNSITSIMLGIGILFILITISRNACSHGQEATLPSRNKCNRHECKKYPSRRKILLSRLSNNV